MTLATCGARADVSMAFKIIMNFFFLECVPNMGGTFKLIPQLRLIPARTGSIKSCCTTLFTGLAFNPYEATAGVQDGELRNGWLTDGEVHVKYRNSRDSRMKMSSSVMSFLRRFLGQINETSH